MKTESLSAKAFALGLMLLAAASVHAQSEVVYTTFPGPEQGGWCIGFGDRWAGVAVRTPEGEPLAIEQIELRLSDESTDGPGTPFSVNLYLDDGGVPGDFVSLLGNGTGVGGGPGASFEIYTVAPTAPVPVEPDTVYWLLTETDITELVSCAFGWSYNGSEPSGAFSYVAERNRFGTVENDRTGTYMQLQITAGPLADDSTPDDGLDAVAVPLWSLGAMLLLMSLLVLIGLLALRPT